MVNRFCAICGKDIRKEESPHFGMCLECYLKENPLFEVTKDFTFKICSNCLSYSKKEKWIKPEVQDIYKVIQGAIYNFILEPSFKDQEIEFQVRFDESSFEYTSKNLISHLDVIIKGTLATNPKIKHSQKVKVNIKYNLCKNCQKLKMGGYISILQIRVSDEKQFDVIQESLMKIQKYVESLFNKDKRQFISKMTDQKYGVDLYLSTNDLLNYLISFLRGKYHFLLKRTKKLVGRDSQKGKNVYRQKALVKFLPFSQEDQVKIDEEVYNVDTILKNRVILQKKDGQKMTKGFKYFFNNPCEVIKREGD
jgi:NMD protein affecting ribosome stability and mRNA decay